MYVGSSWIEGIRFIINYDSYTWLVTQSVLHYVRDFTDILYLLPSSSAAL